MITPKQRIELGEKVRNIRITAIIIVVVLVITLFLPLDFFNSTKYEIIPANTK